jgi:hypothetical protein
MVVVAGGLVVVGTGLSVATSAVAAAATGGTAYVANLSGTVTPINVATNKPGTPITVGRA